MLSLLPQQHRKSDHNSQEILRSLSNKDPFTCHAFLLKKLMGKLMEKLTSMMTKLAFSTIFLKLTEIY